MAFKPFKPLNIRTSLSLKTFYIYFSVLHELQKIYRSIEKGLNGEKLHAVADDQNRAVDGGDALI